MPDSRIRLSAPEILTPRSARIPFARARRWCSPFEDGGNPNVSVFMTQRAYLGACSHGGTDLQNEVGGGLVGRWRSDEDTGAEYIIIEAALPAQHVRHGSTYLTFTQDTLVAMHEELESRYPGRALVGWYHTHPRMGVFLSSYDTWLHLHFFPEAWQVALVIEPHGGSGGFFIRQPGDRLDPHRYFGFQELLPFDGGSVVNWGNLRPEPETVSGPGGEL
jgi:proteasome lid subunit RPN8/RPN11